MTKDRALEIVGQYYDEMEDARGQVTGMYLILFDEKSYDADHNQAAASNTQVNTSPVAVLTSVFRHILSSAGKRDTLKMLAAVMSDCFPDFAHMGKMLGMFQDTAGAVQTLHVGGAPVPDSEVERKDDEEFIPPQRPPRN